MTTTYQVNQGERALTREERILAEQHAEMRNRIIRNDFSTKSIALLQQLQQDECKHLEAKLNKKIAEKNASVTEILGVFQDMVDQLIAALKEAQEKDRLWEIGGAIDAARIDKQLQLGRIIKVCSDEVDLCEQCAACVLPKVAAAEAKANEKMAEVKAKLIELGSGPNAMQAGPSNLAAAERQFNHFVRHRNTFVVAAFAEADHLRHLHQSYVQRRRDAVTRLANAKIFANEQMLKLIS